MSPPYEYVRLLAPDHNQMQVIRHINSAYKSNFQIQNKLLSSDFLSLPQNPHQEPMA